LKRNQGIENLKIVFIYLGRVIPRYVIMNANRIQELFNLDVYLFIESGSDIPNGQSLDSRLKVRTITTNRDYEAIELKHDKNFRQGFWFHTFERLLLLKTIHNEIGIHNRILHVEADMLIMPSFPFSSVLGDRLKWFRCNDVSDVASIVYLPNISETKWLYSQLVAEMRHDSLVTDMSALKRIRTKNLNRIEIFDDLSSSFNLDPTSGIFDGSGLGMWLCGVDPRNTFGIRILHENSEEKIPHGETLGKILSESHLYLENSTLKYKKGNVICDLHCLHIHSKDEDLFCLNNLDALQKYLVYSHSIVPAMINFESSVFLNLLKQNLQHGTFYSYVKNLLKFLVKRDEFGSLRLFVIAKYIVGRRDLK